MKVALVYLGRRGGGNLYTLLMARAVRASGEQVRLFLSSRMENLDEFRQEGFDIETFDTFTGSPTDFLHFYSRLRRITAAIRKQGPDVIYSTMFNPYVPFVLRAFPRTRKICTLHNYTAAKMPLDHVIDRFQGLTIRWATDVLALSSHFGDMVKRDFPGKGVFVIPHPTLRYAGRESELNYGREFGKYILFAGRMTERYKGLEVMLGAFKEIREKDEDLKLVIAGRGADKAGIKGERIATIGKWLSDKELYGLVRNSFVVAIPYIQPNPSGIVAIANAMGVPCVASDLPCLNEQVLAGRNGVLFKAGDAGALADAILALAQDGKRYGKLCDGAWEVAKEFDVESLAPAVKGMLETVAARS